MEPEEFDKQFLAWLEAQTKTTVDELRRMEEEDEGTWPKLARPKNYDEVINEGNAIRDMYPGLCGGPAASTNCWPTPTRQGRQGGRHGAAGTLFDRSAAAVPCR